MRQLGAIRVLLTAVAGAALVVGADQVDVTWRLGPASSAGGGGLDRQGQPEVEAALRQAQISCAGPEQQGVQDTEETEVGQSVRVFAATPPASVLSQDQLPTGAGALTLTPQPGDGAGAAVSTGQRGEQASVRVRGAQSVTVTGTGALAAGVAAMQYHMSTDEGRRALMVAGCGAPTSEAWLLAGAGHPGRQERLVLVNPGANPVTADVEVLGSQGRVRAPAGRGVVVPGRGRTVLLVDALAAGEPAPVVHVTAHGGQLFTALGDSWLEGIVDRGGELTTAAAPPALEQVVPGVSGHGRAGLRIAVPGDDEAVVEVRALTAEGPWPLEHDVIRVPGGTAVDVDVSDLPPGTHALQVRADEAVVAAAGMERRIEPDGVGDLAWSPSQPALGALGGTPLLALADARAELVLVNTAGASTVVVTTADQNGQTARQRVQVAEDAVTAVDLAGAASVWVQPDGGRVRGAVVTTVETEDGPLIASVPVPDLTLTGAAVTVSPLQP